MKIRVPSIPEEGKNFHFDEATGWFVQMIVERLSEVFHQGLPASAKIQLSRVNQNVTLEGSAALAIEPSCARCGKKFSSHLKVPFLWHLTPYFEDPEKKSPTESEEIELNEDDLDFSFYHNEEIDLAEILGEELMLALPLRFLCQEGCKGLCPKCGKNLNEGPCSCKVDVSSHPFAALKELKVKS